MAIILGRYLENQPSDRDVERSVMVMAGDGIECLCTHPRCVMVVVAIDGIEPPNCQWN
jgi:hypothetical protein